MSKGEITDKMAKCIDQFDEHYDDLVDAWQNYFDRFCTRIEELSHNAKKSAVRAISVLTRAFEKESNEQRD